MKRKTTIYVDEDLLRAARVYAARHDKRDSEVIEEALKKLLGLDVLERVQRRANLTEQEAMRLAVEEVRAMRAERKARAKTPKKAAG